MPAKSKKQYRFFKAMENNPELAKEKGLSEETIKDYTKMTKKRFSKLREKVGGKNGK